MQPRSLSRRWIGLFRWWLSGCCRASWPPPWWCMHTCHGSWLAQSQSWYSGREAGKGGGRMVMVMVMVKTGGQGKRADALRGNAGGEGKTKQKSWRAVSIINSSLVYGERDLMWPSRLKCVCNRQRQILSLCLLSVSHSPLSSAHNLPLSSHCVSKTRTGLVRDYPHTTGRAEKPHK